jgi:hypothetical protein
MIETFYGTSLVLLGLWTVTTLCVLFLFGGLAWAVVHVLARFGFGEDLAHTTDNENARPLLQNGRV